MTAEFLAVQQRQSTKLNSGGRPAQYRAFTRILAGDLYPPGTFKFSADLQIRRESHKLPATHKLFRIMTPQQLVCWELHGPPPMTMVPCCGRRFPQIPWGSTAADLRYAPDFATILRHTSKCVGRLVRERPQGIPPARKVMLRSHAGLSNAFPGGRKGAVITDESDWGPTAEYIPPLGIKPTRVPKTCDSQRNSAS